MCVDINEHKFEGIGKTKKFARMEAAQKAVDFLLKNPEYIQKPTRSTVQSSSQQAQTTTSGDSNKSTICNSQEGNSQETEVSEVSGARAGEDEDEDDDDVEDDEDEVASENDDESVESMESVAKKQKTTS